MFFSKLFHPIVTCTRPLNYMVRTICKTLPVVRGSHRGAIMRPSYVQGRRKTEQFGEASMFKLYAIFWKKILLDFL